MILQTETVEQEINAGERGHFIKDLIAAGEGAHPIAMVRKRRLQGRPGAPVLLVHGFGQNRYAFHTSRRSLVNYLASAGFDVFNLDLRGRGRSRRYGGPLGDATLDEYIGEDVPAAIRSVLRLTSAERVLLIGHSMGGLISYSVAGSSMREQVAGVISLGAPYRFGEGSAFLRLVFAPLFYGARLTGAFDGNPSIPLAFISKQWRKHTWFSDNRFIPMPLRPWAPGSMEPEVLEENLKAAYEHTRMAIALGVIGPGRENALKSHDGLTDYGLAFELTDVPLLVVAGTRDSLAPPRSVKPAYDRSRSTDKTYREFPVGHIDMVLGRDAPTSVWPALRTWLEARAEKLRVAPDAA